QPEEVLALSTVIMKWEGYRSIRLPPQATQYTSVISPCSARTFLITSFAFMILFSFCSEYGLKKSIFDVALKILHVARIRRRGVHEIPAVGDLLAQIPLVAVAVEGLDEPAQMMAAVAPHQMAVGRAVDEVHVPDVGAQGPEPVFQRFARNAH